MPTTTRQHSARVPRAAMGAAATSEPSRDTAVAAGPQQGEVAAAVVVTPQQLVLHALTEARAGSSRESARGGS
jgi:hypothetical protein